MAISYLSGLKAIHGGRYMNPHRDCMPPGRISNRPGEILKYIAPVVIVGWSRRSALEAVREPGSKRIYIASNLAGLPNLRHTAMVGREAQAA